jgi:hypothetical protein
MEFMSEKEWRKLDALEHVVEGDWTMGMGAQAAGVSVRQLRRLRRAYERADDKLQSVIHGNSGRRPANRIQDNLVAKILQLRKQKYVGFNDTHFTEKLIEVHKFKISRQSVQRLLRSKQVASPRARKAKKRRKRRERRSRPGWLVLWDGSFHDWLEGRGPAMCLMGAIDDATGKILRGAHFVKRECSAGYLQVLYDMVRYHGIPLEIYADKHSCLRRNDDHWSLEEQLAGRQEPPQVQRAAESLGIEIIWADSPQAKGRIERAWDTFQDRLISEFRLAGVSSLEEANDVLERYRRDHNRRFARKPKDRRPAWRKPAQGQSLAEVCGFHTIAKVYNDSTIRYQSQIIDLKGQPTASIAGQTVEVRHLLNGHLRLYLDDKFIQQVKFGVPTKAPPRHHRRAPSATRDAKRKNLTFKQIVAKHKKPTKTKVA